MAFNTYALLCETPDWEPFLQAQEKPVKEMKKKSLKKVDLPLEKDESNLNSVVQFINTLVDLYWLFGYTQEKSRRDHDLSIRQSIELWMQYADSQGPCTLLWKDLGKWKVASFFSRIFDQEIPPKPKGLEKFPKLCQTKTLLLGSFKSWQKYILSQDPERLKSFALSVLQSKKGAPALNKKLVLKAQLDTFIKLTNEPDEVDGCMLFKNLYNPSEFTHSTKSLPERGGIPLCQIDRSFVENELVRVIDEVFGRTVITPEDIYYPMVPSTSANYINGRDEMGAFAMFYDVVPFAGKCEKLIRFEEDQVELQYKLPTSYGVQRDEFLREDHSQDKLQTNALLFDPTEVENKWKEAYDIMWEASKVEIPMTKTVGLPEPFKVRVITCGPPSTYTVLHSFQRFLWKELRKWKVFQLIGEPITADIVYEAMGKLEDDEEIVSGDYSAATDNLYSWVSETLCKRLFFHLKKNSIDVNPQFLDEAYFLMKRALTGHIIENPIYGKTYDPVYGIPQVKFEELSKLRYSTQKSGQLMGSIVSFPFLCLANAGLCRKAIEIADSRRYNLRTVPLRVNGDDCLLKGKKDVLYQTWDHITRQAGLTNSLGKTYHGSKFCVMNSVHYDYIVPPARSWTEESGMVDINPYVERKYINLGLVYGQKKSGVRGKRANTLGELHHELKKTCPVAFWQDASRLFVARNWKALQEFDIPWYLPKWCGGLGLVRPDDWNEFESRFDRMICYSIMKSLKNKKKELVNKTSVSWWLTPRIVTDEPIWRMYSLAQQDLKQYSHLGIQPYKWISYDDTERDLDAESLKLRRWMILEQLFCNPLGSKLTNQFYTDRDITHCGPSPDKDVIGLGLLHNQIVMKVHRNRLMEDPMRKAEARRNIPSIEDLDSINYSYSLPVFENRT